MNEGNYCFKLWPLVIYATVMFRVTQRHLPGVDPVNQ